MTSVFAWLGWLIQAPSSPFQLDHSPIWTVPLRHNEASPPQSWQVVSRTMAHPLHDVKPFVLPVT